MNFMGDDEWREFLRTSERKAEKTLYGTKRRPPKEKLVKPTGIPSIDVLFNSYCKTHNISSTDAAQVFAGNCHSVAYELVKLLGPEAKLVRGKWLGRLGPRQHSWVEYHHRLVDPTRFQFEKGKDAYIYVGNIKDSTYDKFSIRFNAAIHGNKLPPRGDGPLIPTNLLPDSQKKLNEAFNVKRDWAFWTKEEIYAIVHVDPARLGKSVVPILTEIVRAGFAALIPIDVRHYYKIGI